MGSGASKSAAQSTIRKFPNRAPGSAVPPSSASSASARLTAEPATSRMVAAKKARNGGASMTGSKFVLEDSAVEQREPGEPPMASLSKDDAIRADGNDPQSMSLDHTAQPELAKRLRELGVVQPNPTYSHSSTATNTPSYLHQSENSGPIFPAASQNAVLSALEVRRRVQQEAEQEFENLGLSSSQGRRFLHAGMIRDILVMRERGASETQIEKRFNLRKGVVKTLGPSQLYRPAIGGEPLPV
ncbi:unnamed protein product [Discula destructiva]